MSNNVSKQGQGSKHGNMPVIPALRQQQQEDGPAEGAMSHETQAKPRLPVEESLSGVAEVHPTVRGMGRKLSKLPGFLQEVEKHTGLLLPQRASSCSLRKRSWNSQPATECHSFAVKRARWGTAAVSASNSSTQRQRVPAKWLNR